MHEEVGWLKIWPAEGYVELCVAQISMVAEVEKGKFSSGDGGKVKLELLSGAEV